MHKVIFDTDPGVDDAMALLFLHQHPEIALLGITTVFGNASVETTTRNALYLKDRWQIPAPVSQGVGETIDPARPPVGWPTFIHGDDGLGNIGVPEMVAGRPDPRPAHRFLIETIRANPGEITLVAVGRMTNLARALKDDPDIAGLVKQVVIMGGAFDVPGNITPAAEANIHGDPEAADIVFGASWPVVAVGLDVTMQTVMTRSQLAAIAERAESAPGCWPGSRISTSISTPAMSKTAWWSMIAAPASMSWRRSFSRSATARSAPSAAALPTGRRSRSRTAAAFRRAPGMDGRARRSAPASMPTPFWR